MSKDKKIEIVIDKNPIDKNKKKVENESPKKNSKMIITEMLKTRSRGFINEEYTPTPSSESNNNRLLKIDTNESNMMSSINGLNTTNNAVNMAELWTDETVQQLLDFAEICHSSSLKCKNSSIKHKKIYYFFHISIILLGSLTATTSIGSLDTEIKTTVSTICGVFTAIFSSVQGFLKCAEKSEIEANSCLELERMARGIRLELSKSKEFRVDPFKFIIKLENQREKILKGIDIEYE